MTAAASMLPRQRSLWQDSSGRFYRVVLVATAHEGLKHLVVYRPADAYAGGNWACSLGAAKGANETASVALMRLLCSGVTPEVLAKAERIILDTARQFWSSRGRVLTELLSRNPLYGSAEFLATPALEAYAKLHLRAEVEKAQAGLPPGG